MPEKSDENLPNVSVIVPVYNAESMIQSLLDSLQNLNYPKDKHTVYLVDNNSTDGTREIVRNYPFTLLEETQTQSSYAARNLALHHSKDEFLAFTDGDCRVNPDWLREGIMALLDRNADMAAGHVEFKFTNPDSTAELYDSLIYLQMEKKVQEGRAATANLFVRRDVFDQMGPFDSNLKSGGDDIWTENATRTGYSLVFAPAAVVYHPTRNLRQLMRKKFRTATGLPHKRIKAGRSHWYELADDTYHLLITCLPVRSTKKLIRRHNLSLAKGKFIKLLLVAYLCNLSAGFSAFWEAFKISCGFRSVRRRDFK